MWAGPSSSLWWMVPLIQLVIWLLFVLVMILGIDDGRSGSCASPQAVSRVYLWRPLKSSGTRIRLNIDLPFR